jgi:hypothetical protein
MQIQLRGQPDPACSWDVPAGAISHPSSVAGRGRTPRPEHHHPDLARRSPLIEAATKAGSTADQNRKARPMNLKRLGMALAILLAVSAALVGNASAAAVTEDVQWYTGTSPGTLLTGEEAVTTSGSGEFKSEIGTTKLALKATGLECVECKILNESGKAEGRGKLRFTGVTVVTPSACAVKSGAGVTGQVITEPLRITPDYAVLVDTYMKFEPEPEKTVFAKFELVKGSGTCPISGPESVTGTEFGRMTFAKGTQTTPQRVTVNGSDNLEAGGELRLGARKAELEGSADFSLSGAKLGMAFGIH